MVLRVKEGVVISSIIYRMRNDGRAIRMRIAAGRIVHTVSTSWASMVFVCISSVVSIREIM